MPPPPLAWQPLQLYRRNSRLPFRHAHRRSARTALSTGGRRRSAARPDVAHADRAGQRCQRRLRPVIPLLALAADDQQSQRQRRRRRKASSASWLASARGTPYSARIAAISAPMALEQRSSRSRSSAIALAHAHRDVEGERQPGIVALGRQRRDRQLLVLPRREVAGQRPPDERDVDVAIGDGAHDIGRRAVVAVVAVDRIAATLSMMPRRASACAGGVFAKSSPISCTPIVAAGAAAGRRASGSGSSPARDSEDVAGAVIGPGGEGQLVARRHPDDDVAHRRRAACCGQSRGAAPTSVFERHAEIVGEQLGDAVLEALRLRRSRTAGCSGRRRRGPCRSPGVEPCAPGPGYRALGRGRRRPAAPARRRARRG